MMSSIRKAKDTYAKHLENDFGSPKGSSEVSIKTCEDEFGCVFPEAFREYLLWMGDDAEGVFCDSEWFCKDIIKNSENLPYLLQENNITFEHHGEPLCFFSHQGYMKAWFYLPCEEDDPQCYFFSEGSPVPRVENVGKFSEFLLEELMGPVRRQLAG